MKSEFIGKMLSEYEISNQKDAYCALREILQKIILQGLFRSKLFFDAAFYGGTALRIFFNSGRYSEDLDFCLIREVENFDFRNYLNYALKELSYWGFNGGYNSDKLSTKEVQSYKITFDLRKLYGDYFPKYSKEVASGAKLSIKVEIETVVHKFCDFKYHYMLKPSFIILPTFDLNTLFSSKIAAVLYRQWKNRVKGRDLFDFEFYCKEGANINDKYLIDTLLRWQKKQLWGFKLDNTELIKKYLKEKFEAIDFDMAKEDLEGFYDISKLSHWSKEYFVALVDRIAS